MGNDAIAGARIAVTGASGFVGGRLVRALVDRGAQLEAFGRRRDCRLDGARYTAWDITGGPLRPAPQVDVLVHCAGLVTDWGRRAHFLSCHVDGTRNVLQSFVEPCPVIHLSTASVYDAWGSKRELREEAPPARRHLNAYSESKAMAERIVFERRRAIVLRPHAIYGPGDNVLLPRILDAYRGGRLIAAGNGANRVSLTHVDNLVDGIVLAVQALLEQRALGIFNVADDSPVVIDEALRAVLASAGLEPRIVYLPRPLAYALGASLEALHHVFAIERAPRLTRYRVAHVANEYRLDLTRAKAILGYRPTRNLFDYLAAGVSDRSSRS